MDFVVTEDPCDLAHTFAPFHVSFVVGLVLFALAVATEDSIGAILTR